MAPTTDTDHDQHGKASFDDVYNKPDPRGYYRRLARHDYDIGAVARGVFRRLVERRRHHTGRERVVAVDVCSSYGINAALVNHDIEIGDLYDHYCDPSLDALDTDELVAKDRRWFAERQCDDVHFLGVDVADNALHYAARVGLLEATCSTNLECDEPDESFTRELSDLDLITVTGGLGYVSDRTIGQLFGANSSEPPPWIAAFALRWVDPTPFEDLADRCGLRWERFAGRTFEQRRFADDEERDYVLDELHKAGIDPAGLEAEGGYHAWLYVARPVEVVEREPLAELVDGVV